MPAPARLRRWENLTQWGSIEPAIVLLLNFSCDAPVYLNKSTRQKFQGLTVFTPNMWLPSTDAFGI